MSFVEAQFILGRSGGEDGGFGWVDDSCELLDASMGRPSRVLWAAASSSRSVFSAMFLPSSVLTAIPGRRGW